MRIELRTSVERWPLRAAFRTSIRHVTHVDLLTVELESEGFVGKGEAAGIHYKGETAQQLKDQIEALRPSIQDGIGLSEIQSLLPAGGARNALDCARWDLEAKRTATPVWKITGFEVPKPVRTVITCSADTPDAMAGIAAAERRTNALKLKLTGSEQDADRVRMVRSARPDAWLSVDANQGLTRKSLDLLMPTLVACDVRLIEQPFAVGQDDALDGYESPIPMVADESVDTSADLDAIVQRYAWVNIKLDKCGGLSEAIKIRNRAADLGITITVGNMIGTSRAMAPAFLIAQGCEIVDLDGPLFLRSDQSDAVEYRDGFIQAADAVWGGAESYALA